MVFGRNLGIKESKTTAKLLYVWDVNNPPLNLEEFYGNVTTNYNGHKFSLSVHWSHFVYGWPYMFPTQPNNVSESSTSEEDFGKGQRWNGMEIYQIEFAAEMFNFTWGYYKNTGQFSQFNNETGRWGGSTGFHTSWKGRSFSSIDTQESSKPAPLPWHQHVSRSQTHNHSPTANSTAKDLFHDLPLRSNSLAIRVWCCHIDVLHLQNNECVSKKSGCQE